MSTTAMDNLSRYAPTIQEALDTDGGRRTVDATWSWLRKKGAREELIAETEDFIRSKGDRWLPIHLLALEIISAVEITAHHLSHDRGLRLVVSHPDIKRILEGRLTRKV